MTVVYQKFGIPGVDPKSVVCEYHRQGRCTKGHKCKYSHDLNVERKGGKIDLFTERSASFQYSSGLTLTRVQLSASLQCIVNQEIETAQKVI